MALIRLERSDTDSLSFLFRIEHILIGSVRRAGVSHVRIVKIDNWFGQRWLHFVGSSEKTEIRSESRLTVPPFAPARVVSETAYVRSGSVLRSVDSDPIHAVAPKRGIRPKRMDEIVSSGLFAWYSGMTADQDRGSLMVYEMKGKKAHTAWYAELCRAGASWSIANTVGTCRAELEDLETSYGGRLPILFENRERWEKESNARLWFEAFDALGDGNTVLARILAERFLELEPEGWRIGQVLLAEILTSLGLFDEAERQLEGLLPQSDTRERAEVFRVWADLSRARGDWKAAAEWYRQYSELHASSAWGWNRVGNCISAQGKFEEAIEMHRFATTLDGDLHAPYYNMAVGFARLGRLEEAAEACEKALELCPDYPRASALFNDVKAARLRQRQFELDLKLI